MDEVWGWESNEGTHHSFVADGLDEAVEDLGEGVSADLGSTNTARIAIHAVLPVVAGNLESWEYLISTTFVDDKLLGTFRYLLQGKASLLLRGFIDICLNRYPERVDCENSQGCDESIDG